MILLRICVIYKGELHKKPGYIISYLGSFRGAEIYKAELSEKISRRRLSKCFKALRQLKISFAVTDGSLPEHLLSHSGIMQVDPMRAKFSRIAEMALSFAKRECAPLSFFIQGGSFSKVSEIALMLLSETSDVAVSCTDFEAVAESCVLSTGAIIKNRPEKASIDIFPATPDALLHYCESTAGFSDFSLLLPRDFNFSLPHTVCDALVSALELGGIIGHEEVEIQIL